MTVETLRIKLKPQVTIYVIQDHEQKENEQMKRMNGNGEEKYCKDPGFDNSFQRMK